jgi:hypothetical protein
MTLDFPSASGLFSTLQQTLRHTSQCQIRLTPVVHDVLDNFRVLVLNLSDCPIHITKLLQKSHSTIDTSDASRAGLGGVHFILLPDGTIQPILWRRPLPSSIADCPVTGNNPSDTINMNDFEIDVSMLHHDVLAQHTDIRALATHKFHDNITVVYWQHRSSATIIKSSAYLLHLQAPHQSFHQCITHHDYLPVSLNDMLDDCSRLWHLSDSQLLSYFDSQFPQKLCW